MAKALLKTYEIEVHVAGEDHRVRYRDNGWFRVLAKYADVDITKALRPRQTERVRTMIANHQDERRAPKLP